jgi:ribosomal protein L40E
MSEKKGVLNKLLSWGLGENASAAPPPITVKSNGSAASASSKPSSYSLSRPASRLAKSKLSLGGDFTKSGIVLAGVAGAYFAIAFVSATSTLSITDALPSILVDGLIAVGGSAVVLFVGRGKPSKPKLPAALSESFIRSEPESEAPTEPGVNTDNLILCKKCSAPIPEGAEKCEKCGTPVKGKPFDEYGVCPQGGAHRIYPGALICSKCGKALSEISKPNSSSNVLNLGAEKVMCAYCTALNPKDAKVCTACSRPLTVAEMPAEKLDEKLQPPRPTKTDVEEQLYLRLTGKPLGGGEGAA